MAELMQKGIELVKQLEENIQSFDNTCYEPVMDVFKPLAKIRYEQEENHLVLTKGSIIRLPKQIYSNDAQFYFYHYIEGKIKAFYHEGKLKDIGNREYKVIGKIASKSPSLLGIYIKGETVNGWKFFEGLSKLQDTLMDGIV